MKSKTPLRLLVPLVSLLAMSLPVYSQDDDAYKPIHVTETLHGDGSRTVMTTDLENHTATAEEYNAANKLTQKLVYTLDDQGVAVGATVYSSKGNALSKLTYKYNGAHQITEMDTYTVDDILETRTVYRYGAGGRVVGVDSYDANGTQISTSVGTAANAAAPSGGATPSSRRPYNPYNH